MVSWGLPAPASGTRLGIVAAAAGASHVLLLSADGTVASTGSNNDLKQSDVPAAARVPGVAVAVAAGEHHSLALLSVKNSSTVIAWGDNGLKQVEVPDKVASTTANATAISANGNWSMALLDQAPWLVAWGSGDAVRYEVWFAAVKPENPPAIHW
jgi:alpha-tubulin suppressor-like RCC1 family protein